jgi:hypothetical protein
MNQSAKIKTAVVSVVLAVSSVVLFTGCQQVSNLIHHTSSSSSASSGSGRLNGADMTSRIQTGLKGLVSKGTITQAQSDKIEPVLTAAFSNFGANRGQGGQGQRPQQANGNSSGSNPAGNSSAASGSSGSGQQRGFGGSDLLSSLVSNGTITQAQSDAVIQAIMPQRQGGQGGQASSQN